MRSENIAGVLLPVFEVLQEGNNGLYLVGGRFSIGCVHSPRGGRSWQGRAQDTNLPRETHGSPGTLSQVGFASGQHAL